jgi:hypothetical protein
MSQRTRGRLNRYLRMSLGLLILAACATTDDVVREPQVPGPAEAVRVIDMPDGRWGLIFPPVPSEPALQRFSVEQARAVLAEYHQSLSQLDPLLFQRAAREVCSGHSGQIASHLMGANPPFRLERTLREQYIERYGVSSVPLPECLENSALLMALRLSPRYMPQGVREGAEELFKDPAFLAGVATSLVVYLIAWAAPETASKHLYSLEWA